MEKSDQQLLTAFVAEGCEGAFAEIIQRHGPMVMGTCRRILGASADVEDAFQATFLILARKANSIRGGTSLGGWLYRVAHRASCELKSKSVTDRKREREAMVMKSRDPGVSADSELLRTVLDKEISRLPERYRLPVVLCYLEDRTYEDAARELGWPLGSFKRRMAKARDLLRSRLAQQGVSVTAIGLHLSFEGQVIQSPIPADLVASTAKAAVHLRLGSVLSSSVISPTVHTLIQGGLAAMSMMKVSVAGVVLVVAVIAGGLLFTTRVPSVAGILSFGGAGKDVKVSEYVPGKDPVRLSMTAQILFANGLEIVADSRNNRFIYRKGPEEPFKDSAISACKHPKGIAYNPRDGLYYGLDSNGEHVVAFRDLAKNEIVAKASTINGVKFSYPHGITVDPTEGWVYIIDAESSVLFRFKGIGKSEGTLSLQRASRYCRSVTFAQGKAYVSGSSSGNIIEIDDFAKGKYTVHKSFKKKRQSKVGNWETDGLIPNTADYHDGYWYVGSFFAAEFSKPGKDYNKNKLIRFRTWRDLETGNWEDLSGLLPDGVVPYVLTSRDDALYLAAFQPHYEPNKDKVFRIQATDR